jgi:bacterioferritin (cytochrome b1)
MTTEREDPMSHVDELLDRLIHLAGCPRADDVPGEEGSRVEAFTYSTGAEDAEPVTVVRCCECGAQHPGGS